MGRHERCGGCDDAGKICANCGMCVACAVESLNERESYCTICIGDVLAHVQSQIARLEEELTETKESVRDWAHGLSSPPSWLEDE